MLLASRPRKHEGVKNEVLFLQRFVPSYSDLAHISNFHITASNEIAASGEFDSFL